MIAGSPFYSGGRKSKKSVTVIFKKHKDDRVSSWTSPTMGGQANCAAGMVTDKGAEETLINPRIDFLPLLRSGLYSHPCKITVSQIINYPTDGELLSSYPRFRSLCEYLLERQLVADTDYQSLTYLPHNTTEPFGILDDNDLRNVLK